MKPCSHAQTERHPAGVSFEGRTRRPRYVVRCVRCDATWTAYGPAQDGQAATQDFVRRVVTGAESARGVLPRAAEEMGGEFARAGRVILDLLDPTRRKPYVEQAREAVKRKIGG